ncbi:hypothetical protein [Marinobacter sp.]|uniref:hypothetical protein n=1 Tax=Marinobacter sp. TaxID=50741 RepID=UPI003BAD481A
MSIKYTVKNTKELHEILTELIRRLTDLQEATKGTKIVPALLNTSQKSCTQLLNTLKTDLPGSIFIEEYKHLNSTINRAREEIIRIGSEKDRIEIDTILSLVNKLGNTNLLSSKEQDEDTIREYRVSEMSKAIERLEHKLKNTQDILQSIQSESEHKLEKAEIFLTETRDRLAQKEEQVNQIIGRTTEKAIAGNYETTARNEAETADKMRQGSLAFMTVMVLVTAFTYYQSLSSNIDIASSLFKMSIVLILSIPAGYLARESAKHRNQQHKYEQMALHLKAASPYVENLPEDIKNEIKINLADQIFSQNPKSTQTEESLKPGIELIVKKVLERLEKEK